MPRLTRKEKGAIRTAIFNRQDGKCLWCDAELTLKMAHMHEKIHRGRGGVISLANSIILCADCHLNSAHKDRKPRFGESRNAKKELDKPNTIE